MNIANCTIRLTKISAATVLACYSLSVFAVGAPETFTFKFANGGATATGSFTTTEPLALLPGGFDADFSRITALNVVVTGAPAGNGTFSKANFHNYYFQSSGALNFSNNLAGQANLIDFNLMGNGGSTPMGIIPITLGADNGFGVPMTLSCLYLQGAGSCLSAAPTFTPNSTARSGGAAAVLDALGGGSGAMATAITALGALTPAQQTAALEKLTPSPSRGTQVATQTSMTSAFNQIGLRLDGLRLAEGSFNAPSLAVNGGMSTGLASGDEVAKSGVWLKAYGLDGSQGQKDGFAGYKSSGWGVAAGADHQFAPGLIGGVALTYSDTSLSYRDQLSGNSSGVTSTQVSVYGSQEIGRAYVDGIVAYAQQKYNSHRDTVVSGMANGSYTGDQWGIRLGAGLPIALSRDFSVVPQARIEWSQIRQRAYTESGGGALALSVGSNSAERIRSSIGGQLNYDTMWNGVKSQPFVRAFWHHDFRNNGIDSAASFIGGGSGFTTPGQKLDRETYSIGVGANFYTRKNFTASLSYDLTLGSSYQMQTATAAARWSF